MGQGRKEGDGDVKQTRFFPREMNRAIRLSILNIYWVVQLGIRLPHTIHDRLGGLVVRCSLFPISNDYVVSLFVLELHAACYAALIPLTFNLHISDFFKRVSNSPPQIGALNGGKTALVTKCNKPVYRNGP